MSPYFRPPHAWVGDVIPVERDGEFRLYYLHETREATGMPWHLVTTDDLVTYRDRGEAVSSGGPDAPDFNVYTGSVVTDASGVPHLFYTGHNPGRLGPDGVPLQLVMHAVSPDGGQTWHKRPEDTFGATAGYEPGDWRDPFVFHDEEAGLWRMIVTARRTGGPDRRRGVLAQLTSTDLSHWQPADPLWAPDRHIAHECPDVFRWGDWWYLVYSEFSDSFATKYRMARTLDGPWRAPAQDSLDGRAFYAAKSAARGDRRIFFGWIATREGGHDNGPWQWAGTLATIEAHQKADGTLAFAVPQEVREAYDAPLPAPLAAGPIGRVDGYEARISTAAIPDAARIRAELDIPATSTGEPDCAELGLLLRASGDGDHAQVLRLEPRRGRMVLDRWPRQSTGGEQWQISGDVPHAVELERPCRLAPGRHVLEVILDGDILQATLDDDVTLSTRIHARAGDRLGIFASDGVAHLHDLTLTARAHEPAHRTATRAGAVAATT